MATGLIAPAAALLPYHDRGPGQMACLSFQDEALHHYARSPGSSFD